MESMYQTAFCFVLTLFCLSTTRQSVVAQTSCSVWTRIDTNLIDPDRKIHTSELGYHSGTITDSELTVSGVMSLFQNENCPTGIQPIFAQISNLGTAPFYAAFHTITQTSSTSVSRTNTYTISPNSCFDYKGVIQGVTSIPSATLANDPFSGYVAIGRK